MQVVITGKVGDSSAVPVSGRIQFTQVQRLDNGELLITSTASEAQVVNGELQTLSGEAFSLPSNPEGTAVRVLEMLGGETFEWWTAVPEEESVEYRALPPVESSAIPQSVWGPPPWLITATEERIAIEQAVADGTAAADALGGIAGLQALATSAEASASSAAASAGDASDSADAAATAAASINPGAIDTRFTAVEGRVTAIENGNTFSTDLERELATGSTKVGAFQLEEYLYSNVDGMPRTPKHVWYGHGVNPQWKAGVSAVKAGTAPAKILCIGDSTTYGTAASMPNGWMNQYSWPSRLAEYLDMHVAPAERGLAIPPSDGSSVPERTVDSRWTLGTSWDRATVAGLGLGGKNSVYTSAPSATAYLDFRDPYIVADRFDVYYLRISTSTWGSFRAVVASGGSPVDVNTAGGATSSVEKVTITAPTRAANQQLRIRNSGSSGNVYIIGVEAWDSTQPRVRVANAGSSGSTSSGWLTPHSTFTDSWNVFGFLKAYKPTLTIIDLGINDANPDSPLAVATFLANVKRIADAAVVEGSAVLFKTMIPSSSPRSIREGEYVEALKGLSPRRAVLDVFNHSTYERNVARGWMNDGAHGNDAMYLDEGDRVAEFLARYSGN